jgi:hypothetical protein
VVVTQGISLVPREKESGVNGARTRLIAWERESYVGEELEEANKTAWKRTEQTVYLSIWCQRSDGAPAGECLAALLYYFGNGLYLSSAIRL